MRLSRAAVLLVLLLGCPTRASAWGFVAHRIITDNAARGMPEPLASFYAAVAADLSDASIQPDSALRAAEGDAEARRHYIDLEELGEPPYRDLPATEQEARDRFGDRAVEGAGLLPWRVGQVHARLARAFKDRDRQQAITMSGWLSHYVADAHQPLHTTRNHDGQETCNTGVHAAFESDMVDRRKARYRLGTELPRGFAPQRIVDATRFILERIAESHRGVADLLMADTQAVLAVKRRGLDYYEQMEARAGPLARRQMAAAVAAVASLWHSAWMDAGMPDPPAVAGVPAGAGARSRPVKGARP